MLTLTTSAAVVVALGAAAPAGAAPSHHRPSVRRVSLLYAANAAGGTLQRRHGHLVLTLNGLERHITWFSDRPARDTGTLPSSRLAAAWRGFGFDASPPNAALTYTDPNTHAARTAILVLRDPRSLRHGTGVAFTVSVLDPHRARHGDLAGKAQNADTHPSAILRDPSLFIDDTTAAVADGCLLQAYTFCADIELNGVDLSGYDLTGATFVASSFDGVDFSRANLEDAQFVHAQGVDVDFSDADLIGSVLAYSSLDAPNFSGADLTEAELASNEFSDPVMTAAVLQGIGGCYAPGYPFPDLPSC